MKEGRKEEKTCVKAYVEDFIDGIRGLKIRLVNAAATVQDMAEEDAVECKGDLHLSSEKPSNSYSFP